MTVIPPSKPKSKGGNAPWRYGLAIVLFLLVLWMMWSDRKDVLVVYCAHDQVFSEPILKAFEKETGIRVEPRFDTEATKSLGLVEQILREKDAPRCDVFWNNEPLGTMELAERDMLQPYKGPGYERIREGFKDEQGRWTGFAARMRVWIINRDLLRAGGETLPNIVKSDLSKIAIAKPLYGTTRMQYTVLWSAWSPGWVQSWHADWRKKGIQEVNGNAMVKNLVASGRCVAGLTDTDDFFAAKDEGKPVLMEIEWVNIPPAPHPDGVAKDYTIVIPNTVAILKGTKKTEAARKLADYLLSAQTELALANSPSRQMPLGTDTDDTKLKNEVRELMSHVSSAYPVTGLHGSSRECLEWLKKEYLK